ncbi:MAG: hypothetical protein ACI4XJ_07045 [Eubacteriales bacterium]
MTENELDTATVRDLASVMMLEPDDGEKMRGDILKIKDTIMNITVGKGKVESRGPVMLDDEIVGGELPGGKRLRADNSEAKCGEEIKSAKGYKEPYNTVPRLI